MKPPVFPYFQWNRTLIEETNNNNTSEALLCECLGRLQNVCQRFNEPPVISSLHYNSDVGRMMYSIAILFLFSMVILLLMVRSIRRSNSTIEVETLLDAMRFREELDIQQRQKRRLQKAKNKVTAWLSRTNGKMWTSSPQIVLPNPPPRNPTNRNDSMQSSGSFLPEIVISNSDDVIHRRQNSCTPSLSLLYDFGTHSRKNSNFSDISDTIDLSQLSDLSNEMQPLGSQSSLNAVAGSLGISSLAEDECRLQIRQLLSRISGHLYNEYRSNPERLASADLYSVVMLSVVASIIVLLMVRAIKPSETLDEQVTLMLSSMRARCDIEDDIRHRIRLKEAKLRAQKWLSEAKAKSLIRVRKISFRRSRSTSAEPKSAKNLSVRTKPQCQRASSFQFLPAIVVNRPDDRNSSSPSTRHLSSSQASSLDDVLSQDSYALGPFMSI